MKAITLTQPWASLVALGWKHVETRSWKTDYRGPVAIHAAKAFPAAGRRFAAEERLVGRLPEILPLGAIIATARLIYVVRTEATDVSPLERRLGDFGPGRYAWFLADVEPLSEPVPIRGALGLWEWRQR